MPSVFSKELVNNILGREWSFGYNCYEVGHTWTPSCTAAALEMSLEASIKIVPLYALLYGFSQLVVQRKYTLDASLDTSKSVLRSSFFIFFSAYQGQLMACALRRCFGRFYYRVLVCAPALISCYFSLLIEKPVRRQALAFYVVNLASEILFRKIVTDGYFMPIKHGETLLFACSLAVWYQLLKTHGFGHDPVSAVVKILIGRDEAKSRAKSNDFEAIGAGGRDKHRRCSTQAAQDNWSQEESKPLVCCTDKHNQQDSQQLAPPPPPPSASQYAYKSRKINRSVLVKLKTSFPDLIDALADNYFGGKHKCCPHREANCLRYVVEPIPSRFLLGYAIQSLLRLSSNPIRLYTNPTRTLVDTFTSSASIRFGLFISSLVSSGRLTSCLLRRYSNSNEPSWHGLVSGFVAGMSMLWSPKSSLSTYILFKAIEQKYLIAHREGKVKFFNFTIATIYSVSAATILYFFALEPRFVRPSYMKFLDNMSNHRLHQLNRMVLDVFDTGASVGYEDYFPDLHPKYMSNQFKELIFNWMIQPYE